MLDANQYEGLSDWDAECIGRLEDGSKVYSGPWKEPEGDRRHFVIVEKEDRLPPFWGDALREDDGEADRLAGNLLPAHGGSGEQLQENEGTRGSRRQFRDEDNIFGRSTPNEKEGEAGKEFERDSRKNRKEGIGNSLAAHKSKSCEMRL